MLVESTLQPLSNMTSFEGNYMRNHALIIQKVFTLPSFYFWPNMLDTQLLILHVRGQSHQPRSPDGFFFEFAENLDLLHI